MFKDYVVIDNVLDDPQELVDLAKKISYYGPENKFIPVDNKNLPPLGSWQGYRSDLLHQIDTELFNRVFNQVFFKVFNSITITGMNYNLAAYLHVLTKDHVPNEDWWHVDEKSMLAGVIYLNEKPKKDSGTMIKVNGKSVTIDNKFNRLVMYRSKQLHSVQGTFGQNLDNSRLVLVFFLRKLELSI